MGSPLTNDQLCPSARTFPCISIFASFARVTLLPFAQFVEQNAEVLLLCSHASRPKDQEVRPGRSDRVDVGFQQRTISQVVDGLVFGKETDIGFFYSRPSVRRARVVRKWQLRFLLLRTTTPCPLFFCCTLRPASYFDLGQRSATNWVFQRHSSFGVEGGASSG